MSKPSGSKKAGDGRLSADLAPGSVEKKNVESVKGIPGDGVESKITSKEPLPEEDLQGLPDIGKAISMQRWERAQKAEREQHTMSYMEGLLHYSASYKNYFRFVGLGNNLHGLHVIEIGPADFPALNECVNGGLMMIVEPMPSDHLKKICNEKGITLFTEPFEFCENWGKPKDGGAVEIWLFNVMQHIIDPDKFIDRAKNTADRIRFFEPIDQPITEYHPHTYALADYQKYFGDCVQLYAGGTTPGFHEADCAYGVWIK